MANFEVRGAQGDIGEVEAVLELGEVGVAFYLALDDAEVEVGAAVEELGVELGAADEEEFAGGAELRVGVGEFAWVADEPDVAVGEAIEAELIRAAEAGAPVADAGGAERGAELF